MVKKHGKLTRRTHIIFTNDIFNQIDNLATKLGQTRSGIIRTAVVYYLKEWGGI